MTFINNVNNNVHMYVDLSSDPYTSKFPTIKVFVQKEIPLFRYRFLKKATAMQTALMPSHMQIRNGSNDALALLQYIRNI